MEEKNITSYYSEDHDQLEVFFKEFQQLKRKDYPKAKESFRKFKFGLQRHIIWEEEILFPLFEEKTGMKDFGPTAVMRQEHRQIEQFLEELHQRVREEDPDSEKEEQALLSLLNDHNAKEETILYPTADSLSTEKERKEVFEKMDKVPEGRYVTRGCGH